MRIEINFAKPNWHQLAVIVMLAVPAFASSLYQAINGFKE
jgi:hypothetical protein